MDFPSDDYFEPDYTAWSSYDDYDTSSLDPNVYEGTWYGMPETEIPMTADWSSGWFNGDNLGSIPTDGGYGLTGLSLPELKLSEDWLIPQGQSITESAGVPWWATNNMEYAGGQAPSETDLIDSIRAKIESGEYTTDQGIAALQQAKEQ